MPAFAAVWDELPGYRHLARLVRALGLVPALDWAYARFNASLRARDPAMGVRNFEGLDALARAVGLRLRREYPMPVNNRTLVWEKAGP